MADKESEIIRDECPYTACAGKNTRPELKVEPTELTKRLRSIAKQMRGCGRGIYTGDVVDAIKVEQACDIIDALTAENKAKDELIFAYDTTHSPIIDRTIIDLRKQIEDLEAVAKKCIKAMKGSNCDELHWLEDVLAKKGVKE